MPPSAQTGTSWPWVRRPIAAPLQTWPHLPGSALWWAASSQRFAGSVEHRSGARPRDRRRRHIRNHPARRSRWRAARACLDVQRLSPSSRCSPRVMAAAPRETAARGGHLAAGPRPGRCRRRRLPRILHQADWIAGQLSGRFDVSDENNALKTGYDPMTRRWPDWIAETGFDVDALPTSCPPASGPERSRRRSPSAIRPAARHRHRRRHDRRLRRFSRQRRQRSGRRRHLARHHADAQAPLRRSRSLRRNMASTAIASATSGWRAVHRIRAARRLRGISRKEDVARLTPLSTPTIRPVSTIIRCPSPASVSRSTIRHSQPRLDAAARR